MRAVHRERKEANCGMDDSVYATGFRSARPSLSERERNDAGVASMNRSV